jgi:hypothetical protein
MSLPAKVEGFMGSSGEIISYDRTSLTVKVWARARRHIHTLKGGREGGGGLAARRRLARSTQLGVASMVWLPVTCAAAAAAAAAPAVMMVRR